MYRLENDVQWTTDLKNAFKHNVTRASIIYDGTEINEENNLSSLTLEEQRYISNLGFIGSATARKLEVNLIDSTGSINLENKELTLKIGADYKGNNLIDFSTGWWASLNTTSSFSNDYLNIKNTTYSNSSYVEKDITELIKTNAGKVLKFSFDSTSGSFINFHGAIIIELIITNTSEETSSVRLLTKFGQGFMNTTYSIPNDISNISEVKIRIYANSSGDNEGFSQVVIFKPMLQFGTETKEYEPYYSNETFYINYGNFIVDKAPEVDETNGTIRVVAYDYMVKFDKPYVDRVTYPCTLLVLLQDICSQAGVTLGTTDFANKSFLVTDNQFEGATLRDVLTNIAKCAFSWARIGQDNKLYLDFSLTADNTESITIDDYLVNSFKKANEYYGPVNQVTYADSSFDGQESRVKDQESIDTHGLKELVIYDNLFAYTPDKRDSLIQAGERLLGLTYMPVTQLDLIGLAYLDSRDVIQIGTYGEDVYTTRVFNHTIEYNGALTDSIVTEGTSNNEEAYKNTAANAFQNQQVRFILNKATKQIQLIVEQTADIGDITVSRGSSIGRVEFTKINQSEPIRVEIKPLGENITYLYPRNNLYPANDLYITLRTLRFTNTTTNEKFDYILPDDLLYYDSENFDDFVLDYNAHTVIINKKCKYDANGNVVLLAQPRVDSYTYPKIDLTDGDYRVEILKYDDTPYTAYLFCKLMVQNIYTTQFSTKTETTSKIELSEQSIYLGVNQKLQDYSTTTQMNAAINLSSQSIMSVVSRKVGDDEVISKINQSAEALMIDANKININGTISANGNFKINTNGTMECVNAIVSGNITANSGLIGGFDILSNKLKCDTSTTSVEIRDGTSASNDIFLITLKKVDGNWKTPFFVQADGHLYAEDATIIGSISGSSITGSSVTGGSITGSTITGGTVTGSKIILDAGSANNPNFKIGTYSWMMDGMLYMGQNTSSGSFTSIYGGVVDGHAIDPSITVSRNSEYTSINHWGIVTPTVTQTSKESKKKNIKLYKDNALNIIKNSEIYTYNFKAEKDEDKKHIGFIIGDEGGKYKTPSEVISINGEGIDSYTMSSILWKAMQEILERLGDE